MKKQIIFIAANMIILFSLSTGLRAATFSMGPSVWYAWWDPIFSIGTNDFEMDPAPLYGVALGLGFTNWNFGLRVYYGQYEASWTQNITYSDNTRSSTRYENIEVSRLDIDFVATRKINNEFKWFLGLKIQYYETSGEGNFIYYAANPVNNEQGTIPYGIDEIRLGPGIGLSYTANLGNSFFLIGNTSALLLLYEFRPNYPGYSKSQTDGNKIEKEGDEHGLKYSALAYGINLTLDIAYYASSLNTTFLLGYRFQGVRFKTNSYESEYGGDEQFAPDYGTATEDVYDGEYEYFHGISLTAIYSF